MKHVDHPKPFSVAGNPVPYRTNWKAEKAEKAAETKHIATHLPATTRALNYLRRSDIQRGSQ